MQLIDKFSAVPIYLGYGQKPTFPFPITSDVSLESVEGLFQEKHFRVWLSFVAKDNLKRMIEMNTALIHRFKSTYGTGKNEEDSKDLLHQIFVCLRIVKPTRIPFAVVQSTGTLQDEFEVFSFIELEDPVSVLLPESEVLNHLDAADFKELRALLPPFLTLRTDGPANVRRAIRYYETGYAELHDAVLQFTVWMMGIEALYSAGDEPIRQQTIKQRILQEVGSETDIYREFEDRDLYATTPLQVRDVLDDMFDLRNRFIHGAWAPTSWMNKSVRSSISGGGINKADVMREAASFILRAGLKKFLSRKG